MAAQRLWHRMWESISYHVKRALLSIYGPAELDRDHDPRLALDRNHATDVRSTRHAAVDLTHPRGSR